MKCPFLQDVGCSGHLEEAISNVTDELRSYRGLQEVREGCHSVLCAPAGTGDTQPFPQHRIGQERPAHRTSLVFLSVRWR